MKRIKVEKNPSEMREVLALMNEELKSVKYCPLTAVDIYGKIFYMNETQVRALQVVAAKLEASSHEKFLKFQENVKVYDNRTITKSTHDMHFNKTGYFAEDHLRGFFSANSELMFKIL